MARVYPCEECEKIIHEIDEYVQVAPAGVEVEKRVHADCYEAYKQKHKKK